MFPGNADVVGSSDHTLRTTGLEYLLCIKNIISLCSKQRGMKSTIRRKFYMSFNIAVVLLVLLGFVHTLRSIEELSLCGSGVLSIDL